MISFPSSPAFGSSFPTPDVPKVRIQSIDALRGLVILLMLVDHAREFVYIHAQVSDPVDVASTPLSLFFTRFAAHFCAPAFIALTGISAWLYGAKAGSARAASGFLLKRGLFLVVLEVSVISFAWWFSFDPPFVSLQVIWAIGLSMIALAGIVYLPRGLILALGLILVLGHNLLDGLAFAPGHPAHVSWAILHDRGYLDLPWGGQARTSYPVLPWIGVIALGYAAGPLFAASQTPRLRALTLIGLLLLAGFIVLRTLNLYGDPTPWTLQDSTLRTVASFVNVTKYPPSAAFLLLTLGAGVLILAGMERAPSKLVALLAVFGSAPLFFYITHLYGLHLFYQMCLTVFGANKGAVFGVPSIGWVWLIAACMALPCWFACRWFASVKRRSDQPWMKYL